MAQAIPVYTTGIEAVQERNTEGMEHYAVVSHLGFDLCWNYDRERAIELAHKYMKKTQRLYTNRGYKGAHIPQFRKATT
jgi:hypothetical protein